MEIVSPGKLPSIITIDNMKNERYARNPQISRVLTELGLVKELNEGVARIYKEMFFKKLGVVFTSFALSMKELVMKVYAVSGFDIEAVCDYGVVTPKPEPTIATNIVSAIIVPIILLIGLIVF